MAVYKLAELAEAAGLPARTVRYYSAEGLLPSPHGAGPKTHYGDEHLEALQKIQKMKAGGFSLEQIRQITQMVGNQPAAPAEVAQLPTIFSETVQIAPDVLVVFLPSTHARREHVFKHTQTYAKNLRRQPGEEEPSDGD